MKLGMHDDTSNIAIGLPYVKQLQGIKSTLTNAENTVVGARAYNSPVNLLLRSQVGHLHAKCQPGIFLLFNLS